MIDKIIEDALNAACLAVQEKLDVKTGDNAAIFFCGCNEDKFVELFKAYIQFEILMRGQS